MGRCMGDRCQIMCTSRSQTFRKFFLQYPARGIPFFLDLQFVRNGILRFLLETYNQNFSRFCRSYTCSLMNGFWFVLSLWISVFMFPKCLWKILNLSPFFSKIVSSWTLGEQIDPYLRTKYIWSYSFWVHDGKCKLTLYETWKTWSVPFSQQTRSQT